MKAWINGIGWHTPAGSGKGEDGPMQLPLVSGRLEIPTRKQIFSEPDKRFGRLDDFSRVGLAAAVFCLRDGGEDQWLETRNIGVVAASRYGCLETDRAYLETMLTDGGKFASPNLFAYTLANSFLGEVALRFGLGGNTLVINQRDESRLAAIHFAVEDLALSDQQGMLAGICDLPAPEAAKDDNIPGGLFFLLGRQPGVKHTYGAVESMADEGLLYEGQQVSDLTHLLSLCLSPRMGDQNH